jgi:hypothetical protein
MVVMQVVTGLVVVIGILATLWWWMLSGARTHAVRRRSKNQVDKGDAVVVQRLD